MREEAGEEGDRLEYALAAGTLLLRGCHMPSQVAPAPCSADEDAGSSEADRRACIHSFASRLCFSPYELKS